ncbi:MAG: 2,5-diamino-6-(ribosylamino)-4(3H)-pyrimidinone 5'-phosphate reductase [Euryarchaeota archaeon]|nr:2,5-diamino-6-(ribosylamino)-4(3H)-pyrimidinone 5'-phosphate reductase [Euryarchaeota archaeon]
MDVDIKHAMRPYVIINCASSADGKLALKTRKQTRISSEQDIERVQRLRASCDAILVGVGTVLADDPSLLVNPKFMTGGKQPIRVVLDSRLRTPPSAKVLSGGAKTIIFVSEGHRGNQKGADVVEAGKGPVDIGAALAHLSRLGVRRLMVEGGGTVIWSFLRSGFWDELKVFVGCIALGGGGPTVADGEGAASLAGAVRMRLAKSTPMEGGILLEYAPA